MHNTHRCPCYPHACGVRAVNLMIARMTSTYEKVRSASHWYRAHMAVNLTAEYKDERGQPPPFNIPSFFLDRVMTRLKKKSNVVKGFKTLMGKSAAARLQSRERTMMKQFNAEDLCREKHKVDAQVAAIRAGTASMEQLSQQFVRLQTDIYRDIGEMKEQHAAAMSRIMRRLDDLGSSDV